MGFVRRGELREEQAPPLPWGNGDCAQRGFCAELECTQAPSVTCGDSFPTFCTRKPFRVGIMCGGSLTGAQTGVPTHKADSRGRLSLQKNKLRAGCRASDRIQVLLYALRGEKSVIGGISNPSVAPHLHRKFVREVRSEFLWTVDGAAGRSNRRFAHFFFGTFFFCVKKKVHCPPKGEMGFVRGGELREEQAPPLPWGNGDCARRGVAGGASPSPTVGEWRLCAEGILCGNGLHAGSSSRCGSVTLGV